MVFVVLRWESPRSVSLVVYLGFLAILKSSFVIVTSVGGEIKKIKKTEFKTHSIDRMAIIFNLLHEQSVANKAALRLGTRAWALKWALFRPRQCPEYSGHWRKRARILPLELVPVPGHGAQISARAPTKGYVQTGARARALAMGTKSGRGLRSTRWSRTAHAVSKTRLFIGVFTWRSWATLQSTKGFAWSVFYCSQPLHHENLTW